MAFRSPNEYSGGESTAELVGRYEEMVRKDENRFFDEESLDKLIEYYESHFEFDKALEVTERALTQYPFSAFFITKKAQFLSEAKYYNTALELLAQAKILDATELETYFIEAEIYANQKKYEEAMAVLNTALQIADKNEQHEVYLEMASIYDSQGLYAEVFNSLKMVLVLQPRHREALERLYFCMEDSENYEECVDFYQKLINEEPYSHIAWFGLGCAYSGLDLYEKSIDALSYALAINEEYEPAWRETAEAYYNLEQYQEAIDHYLKAAELEKADEEVLYSLGICHFNLKNYSKAKFYYNKALAVDPHYEDVYFQFGQLSVIQGDFKKALDYYHKALGIDGENVEFITAYAHTSFLLEKYQASIENYHRALHLKPEKKALWINFLGCYFSLEQYSEADMIVTKALEAFEGDAELSYWKFLCCYKLGKKAEAGQALSTALQADFHSHSFIFELIPELQSNPRVLQLINQFSV